jgi:zinc protease
MAIKVPSVRKFIFVWLLALSIFGAAIPAEAQRAKPARAKPPAPDTKPAPLLAPPYVSRQLANGLEVIVLPDSSLPLVTVELAVRNGSFTEPPELNGLSHLYEHMFFKTNQAVAIFGCDYIRSIGRMDIYSNRRCDEHVKMRAQIGDVSYLGGVDKIGYVRNGSTQEEYVNYYFSTTSENLSTIMRLMRDAMLFPSFDEEEFRQEKQVVLGELDRQQAQPIYYLDRALMDRLFYKFPSRKSPGGTRETVAAATTDQMRLIQSRYYVPNNSALIVTGDVKPEDAFKLAEDFFGVWKKGEDPFVKFPIVEHPPLAKSEGVIVNQDLENVIVQIGWHGPSIGKDDAGTYAADVFSYIVEQPNSRFQRAMIDSGLAVSASVHYYTQRNIGPIRITLVTSPEKAKEALAAVYREIRQFSMPGYFTDEELANAKMLLEAEDLYRREKLSEYTHSLGFWWSSTGLEYYRGYYRSLRAVSRKDIDNYLRTYIIGKPHVTVAMVSREAQAAAKLTEDDLIGR